MAEGDRWLIIGGTSAGQQGVELDRVTRRDGVKVVLRLDDTHWPQRCVHKRLEDLQLVRGANR